MKLAVASLGWCLLLSAGCVSTLPQAQIGWEPFEEHQPIWPTSEFGLMHLVDGFPIYHLAQYPPRPYDVVGVVHASYVAAPHTRPPVDESQVVAQARGHGGQAALVLKQPFLSDRPTVQETHYLVVKFKKDSLKAVLELIDIYLNWTAANSNGYTSPDGQHYSAADIAASRAELEREKQTLLRGLESQGRAAPAPANKPLAQ
jgi:hypothetical protein